VDRLLLKMPVRLGPMTDGSLKAQIINWAAEPSRGCGTNAFHQYLLAASRLAGQTRKYENLSRLPGAVASPSAALG
jgi:hypothetical protein